MEIDALEKIGLTRNQATVYLSLLKLGSSSAQKIINESGLHRSRVYDSLEKLQALGLVTYVLKDFKKYFQAVSPEKLLDYLEEQKESIRKVLPKLKQMEDMKKEEISASIYKGKEGLKAIHSDMLKESSNIYILGPKGLVFSEIMYYMPHFERERVKRKIRIFSIFDKRKIRDMEKRQRPLFKGKVFPKGYGSNTVVNIFGRKVVIVLWKEKYPTGFMIENKDVADSFRKWFRLIWKISED